jgi:hypothetical protein
MDAAGVAPSPRDTLDRAQPARPTASTRLITGDLTAARIIEATESRSCHWASVLLARRTPGSPEREKARENESG